MRKVMGLLLMSVMFICVLNWFVGMVRDVVVWRCFMNVLKSGCVSLGGVVLLKDGFWFLLILVVRVNWEIVRILFFMFCMVRFICFFLFLKMCRLVSLLVYYVIVVGLLFFLILMRISRFCVICVMIFFLIVIEVFEICCKIRCKNGVFRVVEGFVILWFVYDMLCWN